MIKRYGASVSPCSTPATMSKYSVPLSGEGTFTLVFLERIVIAATVSSGWPYASRMPQHKLSKKGGKLWTCEYANNSKAQIDSVLINKKWRNSAMNCEAYSSFEGVSYDHRVVTAKIRLSLRRNATRIATAKHYDWVLLNNRYIRDKYVLELRNRYETLQEKT